MWTCLAGVHVLRVDHVFHENVLLENMSIGGHVLQVDMSCGKSCIMSETCLMRGYVLKEDMSSSKTYLEVRNVLHNDMFC